MQIFLEKRKRLVHPR